MALLHPLEWAVARAPLLPVQAYPQEAPSELPALAGVALARASEDLAAALERSPTAPGVRAKLLAYLIRMTTRPTPYGLLAGVALVRWDGTTGLAHAGTPPRTRARPDMAWLLDRVAELERDDELRRQLPVLANPEAVRHGGRIYLGAGVSVRATPAVLRALERARTPVARAALADELLALPGATAERVQAVLDELWRRSLLITALRPPLTVPSPARWVADRLGSVPAGRRTAAALTADLDRLDAWDPLARAAPPVPAQLDSALPLRGATINRAVAVEAARAAELLLRLSPDPRGERLERYRRRFVERYGHARELPLLELLHPELGLGPPDDPPRIRRNRDAVHELALTALRERRHTVELDEALLARLATGEGTPPASLELCVFVVAASPEAIDAGAFTLVVGPNVGADQAGRGLGRFAGLLGAEAQLGDLAAQTELVYLPSDARAANLVLRPCAAEHQIVCGTVPAPGARTIALEELTVGVRDDRFFVRWAKTGRELVVSEQHMLNPVHAPEALRFLGDVTRDGRPAFTGFDWGPAWSLPFLPRIQRGRIVLSLAQWRVGTDRIGDWEGPRHVYLADGDSRLLLDLGSPAHRELLSGRGTVVLQEALPAPGDAWLPGPDGKRMLELVVPLVRAEPDRPALPPRPQAAGERLKPPGSDWLFLKLYCPPAIQDDLIAEELLPFARFARAGMADDWFFIRYADPEHHLRIRFRGEPQALLKRLLPELCAWARGLGPRFAFDTYERELERYGGERGTCTAETIFGRDSDFACALTALARRLPVELSTLAVVSAETLLDGLGFAPGERLAWYRRRVRLTREDGAEWRRRKPLLRELLAGPEGMPPELADLLAEFRGSVPAARPAQLESFVHMHCNRLLGRSELEQLVLRLARRARESLAQAPL